MGKQSALGQGLNAIFGSHKLEETVNIDQSNGSKLSIKKIPLDLVDANPFQPRRTFNEEEIAELAETIKQHGLIQPITVRKFNGRYQIVSGERRTRASRVAGLTEIDAYVHELLSDKNMAEWALIENIQRVDLNPIEVAESYQQLLENYGYTHDDLAASVGKSRSAVTNALRLLKLPEAVKNFVSEGKLSASIARSLVSPDISDPETIAIEIMEKGLNAREVEELVRGKKANSNEETPVSTSINTTPKKVEMDADMQNFLKKMQEFFGTKVSIAPSSKGYSEGTITIHYYSNEDLSRLQEIMTRS